MMNAMNAVIVGKMLLKSIMVVGVNDDVDVDVMLLRRLIANSE